MCLGAWQHKAPLNKKDMQGVSLVKCPEGYIKFITNGISRQRLREI